MTPERPGKGIVHGCSPPVPAVSRALLEGLSANQSDEEFKRTLDRSIQSIYEASLT